MSKEHWTLWDDERPTERGFYWWRVAPREICSLRQQPEFVSELAEVGMGYADKELWPRFSDWNGYKRTAPEGLEWRPACDGEKDNELWPEIALDPCPFCGSDPTIGWTLRAFDGGTLIPSYPFQANRMSAWCPKCGQASAGYTDNALTLMARWNTRAFQPPEQDQ